jgi:hypothetical protein
VLYTGWQWIDPLVSIAIAVVIVIGTWSLLKDSINLALDAVPSTIDRPAIETYLKALPGVSEIHDLHIWAMSTTEVALTVHLVRPGATLDDGLRAQPAATCPPALASPTHAADRFGDRPSLHAGLPKWPGYRLNLPRPVKGAKPAHSEGRHIQAHC